MNPDVNKVPALDVRAPGESDKSPTGSTGMPGFGGEKLPPKQSAPQTSQSQPQAPGSTPTPALPPLPAQQDYVNPAQTKKARTTTAAQTNDDLAIEKECIAKAKAIVAQTSSDPYVEAREVTKVKAELLKRRYGKDLKMSER